MNKYSIVLSGAGSKIMLHVGFMQALHENSIRFDKIAGSSAGSIIASLISCGVHIEEIYTIIYRTNFSKLVFDGVSFLSKWYRLLNKGYVSRGNSLYRFLCDLTNVKRFKDVDKDLYLVSYCLSDRECVIFSRESHPELLIADAVMASSALPFVFSPKEIDGKKYIDGGLAKNFPVDIQQLGDNIIGNLVEPDNEKIGNKLGLIDRLKIISDNLFFANPSASISDAESAGKKLSIVQSFHDISMFDFSVSDKDKVTMFNLAFNRTKQKLDMI